MEMISWIEKYRPQTTKQMVGCEDLIWFVFEYLKKFKVKRYDETWRRAILIFGPPGIGKTTIVYAIANDAGYEVRELNASDARSEKALNLALHDTVQNTSLFAYDDDNNKTNRIILIDEVDGISGSEDHGGIPALRDVIKTSKYPVIMTGNFLSVEDAKNKIGTMWNEIDYQNVLSPTIAELETLGTFILTQEHIDFTLETVTKIATASNGDFRAFVNDLQTLTKQHGTLTNASIEIHSKRDKEYTSKYAIRHVMGSKTMEESSKYLWGLDLQYREILRWFAENIITYLSFVDDREAAITNIVHADRMLNRIMPTQNYALLPYFFIEFAALHQCRKDRSHPVEKDPIPPRWYPRYPAQHPVCIKLQKYFQVPVRQLMEEVVPVLRIIFERRVLIRDAVLDACEISDDQWNEFVKKL